MKLLLWLLYCYTLVSFSNANELKCKFEYFLSHYSCSVRDFIATSGHIMIERITGEHLNGKTDDDVDNLYFEDQNVLYLPRGIDQRFKNLKSMKFINSSVEHLNNDALKMEKLIQLSFEHNNIKNIAENTFQNMRQLQSLNLASNHINQLHLNTFKNMNDLKILNLNWNQLEILEAGVFNDCKTLQTLYLRQNKLKAIDSSILDPLEGLQYIYLQGNVCVDRNDYFNFTELKAEIASKCVDVCAEKIKKLTDGFNLKFLELQKVIHHANDKNQQLSAEVSNTQQEETFPSPAQQEIAPIDHISITDELNPEIKINNVPGEIVIDITDPEDKHSTNMSQNNNNGKIDTYLSFKFTTD